MTIEEFIERWESATGTEKANYQLFLTELCETLGLPRPDPASEDTAENSYVFERKVNFHHGDGSKSRGFIDLYRKGCFVCEAKQTGKGLDTKGWDEAMLRARGQAENYARALPAEEGRPPLIIVTDVGRSIELYAEFTRSGATYTPYPDPRSHRIKLEDLRSEAHRERLKLAWLNPEALDPTKLSARVTREIADRLGGLAKNLENSGYPSQRVTSFLMRCLFTMFAEDVGLLPSRSFTDLLEGLVEKPEEFVPLMQALWQDMSQGSTFSVVLRKRVLRFNGGLFTDTEVLPLNKAQIKQLLEAAKADWRHVEPAIFGTLLERALDPEERHKLGAHYTPRAYVERLVNPAVIEPLRKQWQNAQAAALTLSKKGKDDKAADEIRAFHHHLCHLRVLDPSCGSGNFLYVTLEHLKRLEGEVLETLDNLGDKQVRLEMAGATVNPHQFLGIEVNPRAATIAEMVLWIGYLQWHFRTRGNITPPEPVLRDFHNIECRDAVLAWDKIEYVTDEAGQQITRWDGKTHKISPITGKEVPDESVQVPLERYINPRKAEWPEADYVVGNPPFIGSKRMREFLGDGYIDAIQAAWPEIPQTSDFVLRWWHHAALLTRNGNIKQFGFITTNSVGHTYNRRTIEPHLLAKKNPLSIIFVIPDHPWVDSVNGAAVRISMTVCRKGNLDGIRQIVVKEGYNSERTDDDLVIEMVRQSGMIHPDLSLGVNITVSTSLSSNQGLCAVGFKTIGSAFQIDQSQAQALGLGSVDNTENHIRPYISGRDLAGSRRGIYVIDLFGLEEKEVRTNFPSIYQYLLTHAKPTRLLNRNNIFRTYWWVIGHPRPIFREFTNNLERYIVTIETSKHRFFSVLPAVDAPDSTLVTFGLDDVFFLGVLSSRIHVVWALEAGGRLGVGNDPRYNKTRCFETFPFPDVVGEQRQLIHDLAEQIETYRKLQRTLHPELTLTSIYNVLEKIRKGTPLTAKEKIVHEHGLVSVLRQLHDELDAEVFGAYGWKDLIPEIVGKPGATTPWPEKPEVQAEAEEELLGRLVALNKERHAEEQRGLIRWLRPEYQNPGELGVEQTEAAIDTGEVVKPIAVKKTPWPKTLPEQVQALRTQLEIAETALTPEQLARKFSRGQTKRVAELLDTLVALGQASSNDDLSYRLAR